MNSSQTVGQAPEVRRLPLGLALLLWLVAGALLLAFIGTPPVSRTQEARVLETARQMLDSQASDGWLYPTLNGSPRLEKPPLCYWLAATAYSIAGCVDEGVGRIPTAVIGWLTLGLTFVFARQLFSDAIALLSCAVLLGSALFFQSVRLAETDAPAMLFVMLSIYACWRAGQGQSGWRNVLWLHLCAASAGLAAMAKGGPVAFPLIFLVAYAMLEHKPFLWRRFVTRGAVLTLAAVSLWWYAYVARHGGGGVVGDEVGVVVGGRDHFSWPTAYVPALLLATAPWTVIMVLALVDAIRNWRAEPGVRVLLIWCMAVIVPLCFVGNKQIHYLLPMIPPVMILTGWFIERAARVQSRWLRPMRIILLCMIAATTIGAALIVPIGNRLRGAVSWEDWAFSASLAIAVTAALFVLWKRGVAAGYLATAMLTAALMPMAIELWLPSLQPRNPRAVAREIRSSFGDANYVFFGPNQSLPMCFNLRSAIRSVSDPGQLSKERSGTVVIAQTKNGTAPPRLPDEFVHRMHIDAEEHQSFDLYVYEPQRSTDGGAP